MYARPTITNLNSSTDLDKQQTYSYAGSLRLSESHVIDVTEDDDDVQDTDDEFWFEISTPKRALLLAAPTHQAKATWMSDIRKAISQIRENKNSYKLAASKSGGRSTILGDGTGEYV